jgi:hypothetical protein
VAWFIVSVSGVINVRTLVITGNPQHPRRMAGHDRAWCTSGRAIQGLFVFHARNAPVDDAGRRPPTQQRKNFAESDIAGVLGTQDAKEFVLREEIGLLG